GFNTHDDSPLQRYNCHSSVGAQARRRFSGHRITSRGLTGMGTVANVRWPARRGSRVALSATMTGRMLFPEKRILSHGDAGARYDTVVAELVARVPALKGRRRARRGVNALLVVRGGMAIHDH